MKYRPQLWTLRVYETLMEDFAVQRALRKYGGLLEVFSTGDILLVVSSCPYSYSGKI